MKIKSTIKFTERVQKEPIPEYYTVIDYYKGNVILQNEDGDLFYDTTGEENVVIGGAYYNDKMQPISNLPEDEQKEIKERIA